MDSDWENDSQWTVVSNAASDVSSFVEVDVGNWDVMSEGSTTSTSWRQVAHRAGKVHAGTLKQSGKAGKAGRALEPMASIEESKEDSGDGGVAAPVGRAEDRRGWRHFEGRYAGMSGASCRRRLGASLETTDSCGLELEIQRPETSAVSSFDLERPDLLVHRSNVSLNKANLWDIEEELKAVARRSGIVNQDKFTVSIGYVLPVTGHVPVDSETRQSLACGGLSGPVYYGGYVTKQRRRPDEPPALFTGAAIGHLSNEPPAELFERDPSIRELSRVRLTATGPVSAHVRRWSSQARCRNNDPDAYFAPDWEKGKEQWLELDFGVTTLVRALTVSGRAVQVRSFPKRADFMSRVDADEYKGPSVLVIAGQDPTRPWYQGFTSMAAQFRTYPKLEVQFRMGKGQWRSCGVFNGPEGFFEERVLWLTNALNQNDPRGLYCRRVRLRPVQFDASTTEHEFRGIRVAAFGEPNKQVEARRKLRGPLRVTEREIAYVVHRPRQCAKAKVVPKGGSFQTVHGAGENRRRRRAQRLAVQLKNLD